MGSLCVHNACRACCMLRCLVSETSDGVGCKREARAVKSHCMSVCGFT